MSYCRWKFQYVLYGLGANENVIKIHPPTNIFAQLAVFSPWIKKNYHSEVRLWGAYCKGKQAKNLAGLFSFVPFSHSPSAYNLKPKYKTDLRTLKAISKN